MTASRASQMHDIHKLSGLSDIADRYDAFILDLFGVVHNGLELYPDTKRCLAELKKMGKSTCLLSNTPRRYFEIEQDLEKMGLSHDCYDHIVTAGDSTHEALKPFEGQKCWFAGTERFTSILDGIDLVQVDTPQDADFIVNAISGTYRTDEASIYKDLEIGLNANLPMVCANPDLVVHVGDQMHICAGTYAEWYEQKGGPVSYHGKPHKPVYEQAHKFLGHPDKDKIIAIGDALRTDIKGASAFGIQSVLNLIGIHREELSIKGQGDTIDFDRLDALLKTFDYQPDYITLGFTWDDTSDDRSA